MVELTYWHIVLGSARSMHLQTRRSDCCETGGRLATQHCSFAGPAPVPKL
jgi:hypothetical protein